MSLSEWEVIEIVAGDLFETYGPYLGESKPKWIAVQGPGVREKWRADARDLLELVQALLADIR